MIFADALEQEEPTFAVYYEVLRLIYEGTDGNSEDFSKVSSEAEIIFKVCCFEGEVLNGGPHQLLFNSAGDYLEEVYNFLHEHSKKSSLDFIDALLSYFSNGEFITSRSARIKRLNGIEEDPNFIASLEKADTIFFERNENELVELTDKFIKENPSVSVGAVS